MTPETKHIMGTYLDKKTFERFTQLCNKHGIRKSVIITNFINDFIAKPEQYLKKIVLKEEGGSDE